MQPDAPVSSATQVALDGWIEPAFSGRPAGSTLDTILVERLASGSGRRLHAGRFDELDRRGLDSDTAQPMRCSSVVPLGTPAVWFDISGQYYLVVGNTTVPNDGLAIITWPRTYDGSTIRPSSWTAFRWAAWPPPGGF